MPSIHPSAVVAPGADIADDAVVGPFCTVGAHARIGPGARLVSHVAVDGWTTVGAGCTVFPFASLGSQTQDLKYKGGSPRAEIGDRTTIREYVTVNAATFDGETTRVGSDCHIMAYAHIAHDCVVGNRVIIANAGTLAGHVVIEDQAIVGGLVGIHQFVRIGRLCIIGGCSKVTQDVPPFMMADGHPLGIHGINSVGLKRAGVDDHAQALLKKAFRLLYRQNLTTARALEEIGRQLDPVPEIGQLVDFVRKSERGIAK
jgi:UDP-N-acetylglucosamine acyltransferase